MEQAVMQMATTVVENIYALAFRAGLIVTDGDDPLSRMFAAWRSGHEAVA